MPRTYTITPPEERFWRHVNKDGPIPEAHPELGPCWLWTGAKGPGGYGHFWSGRRSLAGHPLQEYPHRFVYGDVPAGLEVSHLCEVELCVRRSHLLATTHKHNVRYGSGKIAQMARSGECRRGHPFTADNAYLRKNGTRQCRTCSKLRKQSHAS